MKTFFDDVELVKQNIISISDTTKEIGQINQAVWQLTFFLLCV